jgi:xanthine dehydrogenase accessory factor
VVVGELPQPTVVRLAVALASAVYEGQIEIDGIRAEFARGVSEAKRLIERGTLPVMTSSAATLQSLLSPHVIVDARMAKRNLGIRATDAPIVVGLGPGFRAGEDVHAVIETQRGHHLGTVILAGTAEPDTGIPSAVQGHARDRVLWSPGHGTLRPAVRIGDTVRQGEHIASVDDLAVLAPIGGVVRGLAHQGLEVHEGQKIGDIDPRGVHDYCFTISDKARAVAGGVLEAILFLQRRLVSGTGCAGVDRERSSADAC